MAHQLVVYITLVMMGISFTGPLWLFFRLGKLRKELKQLVIARLLVHVGFADLLTIIGLLMGHLCHMFIPKFWGTVKLVVPIFIAPATCFDAAMAVSILCIVKRRRRLLLHVKKIFPILAWVLPILLFCPLILVYSCSQDKDLSGSLRNYSHWAFAFWLWVWLSISIVSCIWLFTSAWQELSQRKVVHRIAWLYLIKTLLVDVTEVLYWCLIGSVNPDTLQKPSLILIHRLNGFIYPFRGAVSAYCYTGSPLMYVMRSWLLQNTTAEREWSEALSDRLDLLACSASLYADVALMADTVVPSDDDTILRVDTRILVSESADRRDSASSRREMQINRFRKDIDQYFLQELLLQEWGEMLGILVKAADDLEAGNSVEGTLRQASSRITEERALLKESLRTRAAARDVDSSDDILQLWNTIQLQHDTAAADIESMLQRLSTEPAAEIKETALAILREKERELMSIFSVKSDAMDELWNVVQSIKDLQPEEEAFADAAIQAARANPESPPLQNLALRAVVRAVRVSREAGVSVSDKWHSFLGHSFVTSTVP